MKRKKCWGEYILCPIECHNHSILEKGQMALLERYFDKLVVRNSDRLMYTAELPIR